MIKVNIVKEVNKLASLEATLVSVAKKRKTTLFELNVHLGRVENGGFPSLYFMVRP